MAYYERGYNVRSTALTHPLRPSLDELTIGTLVVPQAGASEAAVRYTRYTSTSLEDVRVGTEHDLWDR